MADRIPPSILSEVRRRDRGLRPTHSGGCLVGLILAGALYLAVLFVYLIVMEWK